MNSLRPTYPRLLTALIVFAAASTGFMYFSGTRLTRDIPKTNERELKVNIDAGLSDISIGTCSDGTLMKANADVSDDSKERTGRIEDCIQYSVRDQIGYLDISTSGNNEESRSHSSGTFFHDLESSDWKLSFTDAIPIAFDIQFGMGDGDIDLSGLAIKDLRLSTGASSVKLRFDRPNREVMEDLSIEAGLSKFRATGLGNANFNHLTFEGGVGSYRLDFSGDMTREADVDIDVGLGALTIVLPPNVGAKIYYEKSWVAHLTIDNDFTESEEDTYFSPDYSTRRAKLNFNITAGFGTVTVTRQR
jgi:hypothetical protein